jgi:hypothetical protein
MKILRLLLEKKPDLTIKNKKGQTAIDITNSKTIISLFWHYLTGSPDSNVSEESKTPTSKPGLPIAPTKTAPLIQKKMKAKIVKDDVKTKISPLTNLKHKGGDSSASGSISAVFIIGYILIGFMWL